MGATSDSDGTANSVAENAADNTAVGITASASDADATATTAYTMAINTGDCAGWFDIGAADGIVRVVVRVGDEDEPVGSKRPHAWMRAGFRVHA